MNRFFVSLALAAAAATTAGAQATTVSDSAPGDVVTRGHGSFYLQPYVGHFAFGELTDSPQLTLGDKPIYGVQLGYSFSPNVSLVGNVGYSPTRFEYETNTPGAQVPASGNIDLLVYDANLQFRLPFVANRQRSTIAPFIQTGIGAIRFSPDEGNELSDVEKGPTNVAFNAGLGVDLQLNKGIGLRLMAKDYLTSLSWDKFSDVNTDDNGTLSHNIALTAGLNFGF